MSEPEESVVAAVWRTLTGNKSTCIVRDGGIAHLAVPIVEETGYSVLHRPGAMATPFCVTQCELFDAFDECKDIVRGYITPERRWPLLETTEGMPTCLRCLGG